MPPPQSSVIDDLFAIPEMASLHSRFRAAIPRLGNFLCHVSAAIQPKGDMTVHCPSVVGHGQPTMRSSRQLNVRQTPSDFRITMTR
jgi:hypothetical protein